MSVRNPSLVALAILLLVSAGGLGAVLVHDGELGTDDARLGYVRTGDEVTVKGHLEAASIALDGLRAYTAAIVGDLGMLVLVTSDDALPEDGVFVIHGRALMMAQHPDTGEPLVVIDLGSLRQPYVFR